jgi:hypothetical protein
MGLDRGAPVPQGVDLFHLRLCEALRPPVEVLALGRDSLTGIG